VDANKNSVNKYIKFLEVSLKTVQSSRLNLYSCKFSTRNYTQHQHFMLILFKQYIGTDSREVIELVDLMSKIKEALCLDQVPHFITLHKFSYSLSVYQRASFPASFVRILITFSSGSTNILPLPI
jgi:hypothetical protein